MKYEERTRKIFSYLTEVLLPRYSQPDRLSATFARDEVNDMVQQVNSKMPTGISPEQFSGLLERMKGEVQKSHGARAWPSIKVVLASMESALSRQRSHDDPADGGDAIYQMVVNWWMKFRDPLPSTAKEDHAVRMVDGGIATFDELRRACFPIPSDELDRILKRGKYKGAIDNALSEF